MTWTEPNRLWEPYECHMTTPHKSTLLHHLHLIYIHTSMQRRTRNGASDETVTQQNMHDTTTAYNMPTAKAEPEAKVYCRKNKEQEYYNEWVYKAQNSVIYMFTQMQEWKNS